MSVRIRIEHGQDSGRTFRLAKPGVYVLGRHPSASVRLLDMKVSKAHAHVRVDGGAPGAAASVTDLGSTHGTLLNGSPVQGACELHPGDEIRLGMMILRVLSDGPGDVDAEPAPAGAAEMTVSDDLAATASVKRPAGPQAAEAAPRKTLPPDELVGTDLGGYRILEKIGQGGMGAVYVAEQMSLHRKVALKVLSQKLVSDAVFVDQFVNEARAAGQLNHPNVVQVYDVGKEKDRYYFSMEFVAGGSLEDRIKARGPADWREALPWFLDAANAFIFAQKRGILHRDVKPDNLMVAEDGSAKLCDLGLAKKSESQDLLSQGIIGTPHFISPEAIRRKKDIDGRSDLYSLGCAFYRLLTGENPYGGPGKSVKDILMSHLRDPVPRVSAKAPDVPKDLDDVIHKLMQKEPEQRFADAEELWKALDRARIQFGLEAHGLKPGSRKPLAIAAVAVAAALGVAAYFVFKTPEVVVKPKTPEEIAEEIRTKERLEAAKRTEYLNFVNERTAAFKDLLLDKEKKDLPRTWKDPAWDGVAKGFDSFADELEGHETYAEAEEVKALAEQAKAEALRTRDYRKLRARVEREVDAARADALGRYEKALAEHREAYGKALGERRWADAEALALPDAVRKVIQPFEELRIGPVLPADLPREARAGLEREALLATEEINEAAKRLLGDPPAQAWLGEIEQRARGTHADRVAGLQETAKPGTPEALVQAVEAADAYLAELPPEDREAKEGTVAFLLQTFRGDVAKVRETWAGRAEQVRIQAFATDRANYFQLLKALRAPGQGMLVRFRLADARARAEAAAKQMLTEGYRDAALERAEDAKALALVLQEHLRTSFEAGTWANDKVTFGTGDAAKTLKVKAVSAEGISCPELLPWAEMRPAWVLGSLLHTDGSTPRFAFEGEDHRGVAVLAEAVGDFAQAEQHYTAYLTKLSSDAVRAQEEIRRRLAALGAEKAAAEAFFTASRLGMEVQDYLDRHHPEFIGDEGFDRATREAVISDQGEQRRKVEEAQALRQRLQSDPALATTVWGGLVRDQPHPETRYVPGEVLPKAGEPRREEPPPKPPGGGGGGAPGAPQDPGGSPPRRAPRPPPSRRRRTGRASASA